MSTLLVTSNQEGTGKTAMTLALARLAADRDLDVGYMKPMGTRLQSAVGKTRDEDPMLARDLLDIEDPIHELEPVVYSPTFVQQAIRGQEDVDALRENVREAFEGLAADRDMMILEGSGALSTGSVVDLTDVDIADMVDAEVVLVSKYEELHDVDEVLATAEAFGDRLAGVIFNAVADAAIDEITKDVAPYLEGRGIPVLGVLPRVQEMAGVTVAELADDLGAELLTTDASTETFVERFAVGAMGSDAALRQFRRLRNAALITGGDRSNVHTAALEAPGIRCLLLTGGLRPAGAVLGRAETEDVPVLLVQSDTKTIVDRVEEVLSSGRTRDPRTVEHMRKLLEDGADLDALISQPE